MSPHVAEERMTLTVRDVLGQDDGAETVSDKLLDDLRGAEAKTR